MASSTQGASSSYATLVAVTPRLFERAADPRAVALLGQAVSDVLDNDRSVAIVRQMVADLESAHSSALAEEINAQWAPPLTALLGLLRQHLHNQRVAASSANPTSVTLRDKIIAALEAGVDTPSAIGQYIQSPATVVSRVLRQLAAEGRVTKDPDDSDRRQRRYRLLDPDTVIDAKPDDVPTPLVHGIGDVGVLIEFAERQAQINARHGAALLPDLIAAGSNSRIEPGLRVPALAVAGVIVRSIGDRGAADDALDLSAVADSIARETTNDDLLARAAYERARATLFAAPHQVDDCLSELDRAEYHAAKSVGSASSIRLGWCEYTRCLIVDSTEPHLAMKHAQLALEHFKDAEFAYGQTATLVIQARVGYIVDRDKGADAAFQALSSANRHGFIRLMAESAFWAGESVSETNSPRAQRLFNTAAEHFEAVGSRSWRALASASLVLSKAECRGSDISKDDAERLLGDLQLVRYGFERSLTEDWSASTSWAAAVFTRRLGSWTRLAGQFDTAATVLTEAVQLYRGAGDPRGEALALAGLLAAQRQHRVVEDDDTAEAQALTERTPDVGTAPHDALKMFDDNPCAEPLAAV